MSPELLEVIHTVEGLAAGRDKGREKIQIRIIKLTRFFFLTKKLSHFYESWRNNFLRINNRRNLFS